MKWINVNDKQPEVGQTVAFVVKCTKDMSYNGHVYGGRYHGNRYGYHGFSTPGIEFAGSHWMPLPEPPKDG